MENKYYTPELEELFVGYEYEILNDEDEWENRKLQFSFGWLELPENFNKNIRTKYLTLEDVKHFINITPQNIPFGEKGYYTIGFETKTKKVEVYINKGEIDFKLDKVFEGYPKSINELRKVIKMVIQ